MNLDNEELIATKILNGSMSRNEIVKYVGELQREVEKYKKAYIKKRKYAEELEKDLFENCENYVVNKSTIKNKIEELNKDIQDYQNLKMVCAETDEDYMNFVINTTVKIILQDLLKGE